MKKLFYSFLFVVSVSCAFGQVPTTNLSLYLPFNNNISDLSSNSWTLTSTGTAQFTTDRFGNLNKAYFCSTGLGTNWLNSNYPGVGGNNPRTVNYWVKPFQFNSGEYPIILSYGAYDKTAASMRIGININGEENLVVDIADAAYSFAYPTSNLLYDGDWHMLTYVIPGSSLLNATKFYFDGVLLTTPGFVCCSGSQNTTSPNTDISTQTISALNVQIGTFSSGLNSSNNYKGGLDDVRFYEKALTFNEIQALFNESNPILSSGVLEVSEQCSIYPNPTNEAIHISFSEQVNSAFVRVINSSGIQIFNTYFETPNNKIQVSQLGKPGIYLVQLLNKDNSVIQSKKIIVE